MHFDPARVAASSCSHRWHYRWTRPWFGSSQDGRKWLGSPLFTSNKKKAIWKGNNTTPFHLGDENDHHEHGLGSSDIGRWFYPLKTWEWIRRCFRSWDRVATVALPVFCSLLFGCHAGIVWWSRLQSLRVVLHTWSYLSSPFKTIFYQNRRFLHSPSWILVAIMNQIWQKRFELMSRLMIFPTFHHHKCLQKNRSVQHVVLVNLQGFCAVSHDGWRQGTMMRLKMPIVTWARGEDPKQLQAIGFSFFVCDPTLSACGLVQKNHPLLHVLHISSRWGGGLPVLFLKRKPSTANLVGGFNPVEKY